MKCSTAVNSPGLDVEDVILNGEVLTRVVSLSEVTVFHGGTDERATTCSTERGSHGIRCEGWRHY